MNKLKKLLYDIHGVSNPNFASKSINKSCSKLANIIEEKLKVIKELAMLSYCIENFDNKGNGPQVLHSFLQMANKKPTGYKTLFSPIKPKDSGNDLRKTVLQNYLHMHSSEDSAGQETVLSYSYGTISSEESLSFCDKRVHCYSPVFLSRKPFDKTEDEEHIESLFSSFTKPKRKVKSCGTELKKPRQRLAVSCTLDYSLTSAYYRIHKRTRCNSTMGRGSERTLFEENFALDTKVSLEDFEIIKGLNSGAYGKVCLVRKRSSGDYFAMKIIDKEKTMENFQESLIRSELAILRNVDNDYIVKLYYSFQNSQYLFFVMEHMNGGDLGNLLRLFTRIEEKVRLHEEVVCLLVCCGDCAGIGILA